MISLLVIVFLAAFQTQAAPTWKEGATCVEDSLPGQMWKEKNGGATIHAHLRNEGPSASLKDLFWNGEPVASLRESRTVVWWRLQPRQIRSGDVGEITLRLRRSPKEEGLLSYTLSNGENGEFNVSLEKPAYRILSIGYDETDVEGKGLKGHSVLLYVECLGEKAPVPKHVALNGQSLKNVRWLSKGWVGGVRVAVVEQERPLSEGTFSTWSVGHGNHWISSTVRAVRKEARFGTYGYADFERFEKNGLSSYASFGTLDKEALDSAHQCGIAVAMHISGGMPPEETVGHEAVMGYLLPDEPDCKDYSAAKDIPMDERIGFLAQDMVSEAQSCAERDRIRPVMLTLDLTFTPANYFTYGPIADLVNADCYPVTIGRSVSYVKDCAMALKAGCAPRPCTFTYQGCWEEYAIPPKTWLGPKQIRERGFESLVDEKRTRGFGRPPSVEEIQIQMLYAIGGGARGLFSYTDATECGGELLFHGTMDLPSQWEAIGRYSRTLRTVASLIEKSHAMAWAKSDVSTLWVRTLVCGEDAALVVVVNEDFVCDVKGLDLTPAKEVAFTFRRMPWLDPKTVSRVREEGLEPLETDSKGRNLSWKEKEIRAGEIYLVEK